MYLQHAGERGNLRRLRVSLARGVSVSLRIALPLGGATRRGSRRRRRRRVATGSLDGARVWYRVFSWPATHCIDPLLLEALPLLSSQSYLVPRGGGQRQGMIRPGAPTPLPPLSWDAALLVLSSGLVPPCPPSTTYSLLPVRSALGPWVLLSPVLVVSWSQGRRSSGRTQPDASSGSGTG